MRKSLHEIQQIENYIFGRMSVREHQDFQVRLLVNPHLQEAVDAQKASYALIRDYGRKKLKAELDAVHEKLFTHPEKKWFRQLIKNIFNAKK
jgi:hypothetical protein